MDVSTAHEHPRHRRLHGSRAAPWSALAAALVGEGLHHQVLSDMLRFDCRLGGPMPGLLAGIGVFVLIALGCVLSWLSVRGLDAGDPHAANRRFIVRLGYMVAGLMAVAVAWQTLGMFLVPACAP